MDISDPKLDVLERDIAARLKPVCTDMSPEAFMELVHDIARVKLKYEPDSPGGEQRHGPAADSTRTGKDSKDQGPGEKSSA